MVRSRCTGRVGFSDFRLGTFQEERLPEVGMANCDGRKNQPPSPTPGTWLNSGVTSVRSQLPTFRVFKCQTELSRSWELDVTPKLDLSEALPTFRLGSSDSEGRFSDVPVLLERTRHRIVRGNVGQSVTHDTEQRTRGLTASGLWRFSVTLSCVVAAVCLSFLRRKGRRSRTSRSGGGVDCCVTSPRRTAHDRVARLANATHTTECVRVSSASLHTLDMVFCFCFYLFFKCGFIACIS